MTKIAETRFVETDIDQMTNASGTVAVLVGADGKLDKAARRANRLSKGAVERAVTSDAFEKLSAGEVLGLAYPVGFAATSLIIAKLDRTADQTAARKAGVALAKAAAKGALMLFAGNNRNAADVVEGAVLRAYAYQDHKSDPSNDPLSITVMASKADALSDACADMLAVAEGVFFTRDLTNAPANDLTTTEFANQLADLSDLGVKVEVLEEDQLAALGMNTLLCVGQGSDSPSKVVVMEWNGGGDEAPFALVGKGVVFDTGGISLKPAGGMEDMTMDMGGAGVVAGTMKALALRKARANVVALVGLVENMPSGNAVRPGDIVKSMKGDTVEVINTDAEGRLVLADVLWYAQERFNPCGMINLATLTGAIIIGLGHDNAGVFSNSDDLSAKFLDAAAGQGEGAWRMPMGPSYDKLIKSDKADMKNVGGRAAGSITAAQFLQRFVKDDMPWAHLDIAGVASIASESSFAPKGATGWGVRSLNAMIRAHYEAD